MSASFSRPGVEGVLHPSSVTRSDGALPHFLADAASHGVRDWYQHEDGNQRPQPYGIPLCPKAARSWGGTGLCQLLPEACQWDSRHGFQIRLWIDCNLSTVGGAASIAFPGHCRDHNAETRLRNQHPDAPS